MALTSILLLAASLAVALCHECHDPASLLWNNDYLHKHETSKGLRDVCDPLTVAAKIQAPAPQFSSPAVIGGEIKEFKLSELKGVALLFDVVNLQADMLFCSSTRWISPSCARQKLSPSTID